MPHQTPDSTMRSDDCLYLDGLNPPQREAVESLDGPVLVLAGAGTGKTRVLTTRLAHLLRTNRAWPSQILAVTFTNKAAQEMKHRVSALLGGQTVEGWWLGTFHALSARMLRAHAGLVGLSQDFTILDADDQVRLIKSLMEQENIDTKKWNPRAMAGVISLWKDKALRPGDLGPKDGGEMADGRLVALYHAYQARLKIMNACDFGDLLLHVITLLRDPKNAPVLEQYHHKFKYLLVDEYQDTNAAQYLWLRLLARGSGNICCVGDDDQSIYGWRGAEVGNILKFEQDFPGAKIIRLEQNYRSTGHILNAAGGVIAHNKSRLGKTLWSESGAGDKVIVRGLWDGGAEARWVGEEMERLRAQGWDLDQMAVLVRAGFQTREFEERFIQLGLPYRVIGGLRFYERQEIRDALAYLRVIAQPADDLALERIINTPKRGIGDTTVQALYAHARSAGVSLYEAALNLCETEDLSKRARGPIHNLLENFERWRSLVSTMNHSDLAGMVLEDSGYLGFWQKEKTPDAAGRVENLKELVAGMRAFESLAEFLEHVSLVLENQQAQQGGQVSIMTLHAAKGLEFDATFLTGWEDGLFPSQRTMDENGMAGLEEERRLAYVGITRARRRAHISFAANRQMYGNWTSAIPSRFLEELPAEHIDVRSESGLYGAGRSAHWDSSGATPKPMSAPSTTRDISRKAGTAFSSGTRVNHDKFGAGTVVHVQGNKLDINFDSDGMKRVLDSFVEKLE
ncbi:MAG: UvrD-helicase domain-containing protein [Rhodospirillales bacterium]|nr:UvrD-helicase domain-containing protein [Rhodospirillales bacterium]